MRLGVQAVFGLSAIDDFGLVTTAYADVFTARINRIDGIVANVRVPVAFLFGPAPSLLGAGARHARAVPQWFRLPGVEAPRRLRRPPSVQELPDDHCDVHEDQRRPNYDHHWEAFRRAKYHDAGAAQP